MLIITICFGLVLIAFNVVRTITWEKTDGIVLKLIEREDNETQLMPLVEFETISGEMVRVIIKQSSFRRNQFEKGEEIPIIYPKDNHKKAKINSIGWIYGFPLIFVFVGIIGFLIPDELWHSS